MNDLVERLRDGLLFDADVDCRDDGTCRDILIEAADRLEATERLVEECEAALQWMVDNDDTNEGDEPMSEFGGQTWDEINAYWLAGLNRARTALASIAEWRKP